MKWRKMLSIVLCVAAVLSVMTAVAYATNQTQAAIGTQALFDVPSTYAPSEVPDDFLSQLGAWWADFYPTFDAGYKNVFNWFSRILTWGFQILLTVFGLNLWEGSFLSILNM